MRTDFENLHPGDVVQTRNGERFTITDCATLHLPIDRFLNTAPCMVAATKEHLWYFLYPDANHFLGLQLECSDKIDSHTGGKIDYYAGCNPSPMDVVGYYKGFVQLSLF